MSSHPAMGLHKQIVFVDVCLLQTATATKDDEDVSEGCIHTRTLDAAAFKTFPLILTSGFRLPYFLSLGHSLLHGREFDLPPAKDEDYHLMGPGCEG